MLFWMHRCLYGTETLGAAPEHGDGLNIWPLEAPSSHLLLWCCPKKTLLGQPLKPASVARRMFLQVSLYLILSRNWALKGWRSWGQWYPKQSRWTSEGAPAAQRPMVYGVGDLALGVPSSWVLFPCSPVESTGSVASPATPRHCRSWA